MLWSIAKKKGLHVCSPFYGELLLFILCSAVFSHLVICSNIPFYNKVIIKSIPFIIEAQLGTKRTPRYVAMDFWTKIMGKMFAYKKFPPSSLSEAKYTLYKPKSGVNLTMRPKHLK